jgi:hypothetical protein
MKKNPIHARRGFPKFEGKGALIQVSDLYFEPFGIGPDAIHSVPKINNSGYVAIISLQIYDEPHFYHYLCRT